MKILVTGSSGLLGIKLTDLIMAKGVHEVCGLSRSDLDADYPFYRGDITDWDFLAKVFQKEKPDVVVNTAAMTNVDQCELDNESGGAVNGDGVLRTGKRSWSHATSAHAYLEFISFS